MEQSVFLRQMQLHVVNYFTRTRKRAFKVLSETVAMWTIIPFLYFFYSQVAALCDVTPTTGCFNGVLYIPFLISADSHSRKVISVEYIVSLWKLPVQ
jgi:hypothetical protein